MGERAKGADRRINMCQACWGGRLKRAKRRARDDAAPRWSQGVRRAEIRVHGLSTRELRDGLLYWKGLGW